MDDSGRLGPLFLGGYLLGPGALDGLRHGLFLQAQTDQHLPQRLALHPLLGRADAQGFHLAGQLGMAKSHILNNLGTDNSSAQTPRGVWFSFAFLVQ